MASSQSCSMIQRRISLSPLPAPPVKSGEPLKTMAMREPGLSRVPGFQGWNLADHVEQKQQRAVVDSRQLAAVAAEVGPAGYLLLLPLPVHAKGRIGQQVVEAQAAELVVGERVAELDAAVAVPLD